ncbi:DUF3800 domain-containing protein [Rhodococcus hoagii]|nr:DUF3800 domain-containing protein [Prescottella equi]
MSFLDETGAIAADRFFAVGVLTHSEPSRLTRAIGKLRDRQHVYREFHFTELTRNSLPIYRDFVDICAQDPDLRFYCFVADRQVGDPVARFGDTWTAYAKMAEQLLVAAIRPGEIVSVIADNYSTPDHVLFEEDLKKEVNRRHRRLAVSNVCRMDSRASDGLQAADLLTSAVTFQFRQAAGLAGTNTPKPGSRTTWRISSRSTRSSVARGAIGTVSRCITTILAVPLAQPGPRNVPCKASGVGLWPIARFSNRRGPLAYSL